MCTSMTFICVDTILYLCSLLKGAMHSDCLHHESIQVYDVIVTKHSITSEHVHHYTGVILCLRLCCRSIKTIIRQGELAYNVS